MKSVPFAAASVSFSERKVTRWLGPDATAFRSFALKVEDPASLCIVTPKEFANSSLGLGFRNPRKEVDGGWTKTLKGLRSRTLARNSFRVATTLG